MAFTERTLLLSGLPRRRPVVPGIERGQIVSEAKYGRRFRVLAADEWVIVGTWEPDLPDTSTATGPYARLQALDDPACTVIWPRGWYVVPGQQLELLEVA